MENQNKNIRTINSKQASVQIETIRICNLGVKVYLGQGDFIQVG